MAKYLLSIEEFVEKENGEALMERAFSCVDDTRRRKAECLRLTHAKAACLGAGLLLQLAVGEALGEKEGNDRDKRENSTILKRAGKEEGKKLLWTDGRTIEIEQYSVSQLFAHKENKPRISLDYRYGEAGKPYFKDLPYYFNLSHSGNYVLCALSDVEIGADIQQHCGKNVEKLAQRFFSEHETVALEQAGEEREKLFYKLWTRKEAYGKLTGKGIAGVLEVDLLPKTVLLEDRRLVWEEEDIEDYSIAFCRYG